MKPRHAAILALLGWCLFMDAFLPPNLTANADRQDQQFVCFDSPEQCNLARHWLVASLGEQWARTDIRELEQNAKCFQYVDPLSNPDF